MLADTIAASPIFYLQPCLMLFSIGKCFPQARKFRATDTFLLFPSDTFLLLPSDTFFPTWHFLAHPDILKDILSHRIKRSRVMDKKILSVDNRSRHVTMISLPAFDDKVDSVSTSVDSNGGNGGLIFL